MSAIGSRYDGAATYDLTSLRYVQAIAKSGSMTAAARALRVSQPTLSVAIRELEARVGTALFHRNPRGVTPTVAGQALVRTSEAVVALLQQLDDEIRGLRSEPAGRFVVGCYHSFGAFFLPELLRDLGVQAPALEVALWEGTGPQVRDAVLDRTVHFGVDAGLEPRPHPDLVIVPMFRDVIGVVGAARTRARARGKGKGNAKSARPKRGPLPTLFHVPRIPSSERVVEALRLQGRLPERVVSCGDLELVKSLVLQGVGLGVLPWRAATCGTPRGALRLVDPAWPFEVDVGSLMYRADLHRTRGAAVLHDAILARGVQLDAVEMPGGVPRIRARRPRR